MLYSLCYVPADEVVFTFNDVILPLVEHGLDNYEDWIDYAAELEEFGKYFSNTWICQRNGRSPLFMPKLWNHFESVKEGGAQTYNMLKSCNRTWNSLVDHTPNVWHIQELFNVHRPEEHTYQMLLVRT